MATETKITERLKVSDIGIVLTDDKSIEQTTYGNNIPVKDVPLTDTIEQTNISYKFGIENISFDYHNSTTTSGFISDIISIGSCDYTTLNCSLSDQQTNEYYSVEFYIVDGNNELPILPFNQSQVHYEKMFIGLDTRFIINQNYNVTISQFIDNDMTTVYTYSYNDYIKNKSKLDNEIKSGKEYLISYIPANGKRVKINNTSVYVKAIKRLYDSTQIYAVDNIMINAHGGMLQWIR